MRPRYLHGYGLIEAPLADCMARIDGARRSDRTVLRRRRPDPASREAAIRYLRQLSFPATRWALFALNDRWTAAVTNGRDGSDFADHTYLVSRLCQTRVCRIVDHDPGPPQRVGPYQVRNGYPARIFDLRDPGGTVRTISCMLDGDRWSFDTSGEPLPAEADLSYLATPKKNRFTSENLHTLLRSIGVDPPAPDAFDTAEDFHLIEETWRQWWRRGTVAVSTCTTEQEDDPGFGYFRRGMGWVPHLRTHASSIVVDLTRAALLSPHLRERAAPHLANARRQLGDHEFQRLANEADAMLRRGS